MRSVAPIESNGLSKANKYQNGVNTIPLTSKALRLAIQTPDKFIGVEITPKNNAQAQRRVASLILVIAFIASSFENLFGVTRLSDSKEE